MPMMKAVQVTKPNAPFEIVQREIPTPGPRWVRIKVEACGVCHSDVFTRSGAFPGLSLPRIPGHEIAGRIDALGEGVAPWKVGDRVGVGWHGGHDFTCEQCRRGHFLNCINAKITGISHDGGYAEYVVVPQESVARIPESLDPKDAGPLMCAGLTTYNALRHSGATPGMTVAVQGIGGLGHLAVQYAVKMGFRTIAITRGGSDKVKLARELGAHEVIDSDTAPVPTTLQKLGGADVVLATAPQSEAIQQTIDGLKPRGKLMLVAAPLSPISVPVPTMISGKQIHGWPSGTSIDSEDTMKFSVLTGVKAKIEVFKLADAERAFISMMEGRVRFRAVLVP
jgi:D-arabinose 1-dehydrogenase-like Zn-dependent alcohol dehydrogenase